MTLSEFWAAVDAVYGSTLGRSLTADLYIPALGSTSVEALERGRAPMEVWAALVEDTGRGEEARWVHRRDTRARRRTALR